MSNKSANCTHKKVALVTGSGSGIGANIAIDLAAADYRVVVTGRNIEKLNEVQKQCKDAVAFVADLSDFAQVDRLIEFIRNKFNRLDVLVNNACFRGDIKDILEDGAYEDLEKVMKINLSVPMYLIHKCLMPLKYNDIEYSLVVNISSVASQVVVPLHLYSISKACLSEMSKQLAGMSKSTGVLSISIAPGPVLTNERPHHTEMAPLILLKRVGSTQEVSNLVRFAIENAPLFNGKELNVDGGYAVKTSCL